MRRVWAFAALLGLTACDARSHVEVHLRVAAGTHPLAGADAVTLVVAGPDGAPLVARRVPAGADGISASAPVVAGPLTVRLEASHGADVLARGRSCPAAPAAGGATLTVELPLQQLGTFAPAPDQPEALSGAALLPTSDGLLFVGGLSPAGAPLPISQLYLAGPGRFTDGPAPTRALSGALPIAFDDGSALLLGGASGRALGVQRYADGAFADGAAAFPGNWLEGAAVRLDAPSTVLAAGGRIGGDFSDGTWMIAPDGSQADAGPTLPSPRAALTLTRIGPAAALAAGGLAAAGALDELVLVDLPRASATPLGASLARARHGHTATLLPDGTILIAGGTGADADGQPIGDAERVDPVRRAVTPAGTLAVARTGHAAVLLGDGRVLLVGGVGAGGAPLADAELWDPSLGSDGGGVITAPLGAVRDVPRIAPLCDGTLLVAGGAATVDTWAPLE